MNLKDEVVHTCNISPQEDQAFKVTLGYLVTYFKDSLSYTKLCLKNKMDKIIKSYEHGGPTQVYVGVWGRFYFFCSNMPGSPFP